MPYLPEDEDVGKYLTKIRESNQNAVVELQAEEEEHHHHHEF